MEQQTDLTKMRTSLKYFSTYRVNKKGLHPLHTTENRAFPRANSLKGHTQYQRTKGGVLSTHGDIVPIWVFKQRVLLILYHIDIIMTTNCCTAAFVPYIERKTRSKSRTDWS